LVYISRPPNPPKTLENILLLAASISNPTAGCIKPYPDLTIFLFLAMPLVLGSLISFGIFLVYPFIIVKRIKNEEDVLSKDLKGYKEYMKKVKYRLIPFIW
jgi:hypothetical protein